MKFGFKMALSFNNIVYSGKLIIDQELHTMNTLELKFWIKFIIFQIC